MADDGNNGQEGAAANQPSISVIAQYVKDLSFENPGAPATLRPQGSSPSINVSVGVQPRPVADNDVEVELRLEARAVDGGARLDRPRRIVDRARPRDARHSTGRSAGR